MATQLYWCAFLLYCTYLLLYIEQLLYNHFICVYVFICGGHHDSDRMAVLVMVSKAESIVLYFTLYMYTCQN